LELEVWILEFYMAMSSTQILPVFEQLHGIIVRSQPSNHSLLSGSLGLSLYYFSRYEVFGEAGDAEAAAEYAAGVLEQFNDEGATPIGANYATGSAGMMYLLNLLERHGLIELDMNGEFGELDAFLYQTALQEIAQHHNDFLHGAMGIVHYFLSRLPQPAIEKYLHEILTVFCNHAVAAPEGLWFRNFVVPTDDLDDINFSLSHGQSSFLMLLVRAWQKGIRVAAIPEVVEKGIALMHHYQVQPVPDAESISLFPSWVNCVDNSKIALYNRLAWCYGDLNVIQATLEAGEFLAKPEWVAQAHAWGRATLERRTLESVVAQNSHFCHGTAGLAQYYHCLFTATGLPQYEEGAAHWLQETLRLLPADLEEGVYKDGAHATELLDGLVGINLVLLQFISKKLLHWPRALLLP
jgi:lantibiotic biosynthesis protein